MREPGIPPYIPELPFPHESLLNYRKRVEAIRGIVTSPSGLESTVIVLVYGLDLYSTRLAPSKGMVAVLHMEAALYMVHWSLAYFVFIHAGE